MCVWRIAVAWDLESPNKPKEKIQNNLPAGGLTDLARLVPADAIYFKGVRARQF